MRSPATTGEERDATLFEREPETVEAQPTRSSRLSPTALVTALRPHQWAKNGFVLAPLVFSKNLFDLQHVAQAVEGFFLFSFTASAVYLVNDVLDRESDRLHPTKKNRPIASGKLSPAAALAAAAVLGPGSLLAGLSLGPAFVAVLLTYLAVNSLYSLWLKRIAWVDVGVIASGFVLRVLAGAIAIGVATSHWLFVCTFALALYLALGKRKHEILSARLAGRDGAGARAALGGYTLRSLRVALTVAGVLSVASYFLYTLAPETFLKFGTYLLAWTVPFPAFGTWRFGKLLSRAERASSPTEAILTDPPFLLNLGLWLLTVVAILYAAGGAPPG